MKKQLLAILSVLTLVFVGGACSGGSTSAESSGGISTESVLSSSTESSVADSSQPNESTPEPSMDSQESSLQSSEEVSAESSATTSVESSEEVAPGYKTYQAFTKAEKALFVSYFGETIPFIGNNEYCVEEYSRVYEGVNVMESGLKFCAYDNGSTEFEAYKTEFDNKYAPAGSEKDENGTTWYFYDAENYYVDLAYYNDGEREVVEVHAYVLVAWNDDSSSSAESSTDSSIDSSIESNSSADPSIDYSAESSEASSEEGSAGSSEENSSVGSVQSSATLDFTTSAARVSQNDDAQVWKSNGLTITNNKNESTQPIKDYTNPLRLYAKTDLVIEFDGMTKLVFNVETSSKPIENLLDSLANNTGIKVSDKGNFVTVVFDSPVDSFTVVFVAQVRLNSITAYAGEEQGGNTSSDSSSNSSSNSSDVLVDGDVGEILLTLYGLADGESVTGEFTLTGKIIALDSHNNPTIEVAGFEDMPVYCYKLQLPDASVGDVITVTASTMKNYMGTYEFMNCTLVVNQGGGNGGNEDVGGDDSGNTNHTYTGFTTDEKAMFESYFGEVIPFIANDEYYVEEYTYDHVEESLTEMGINFYAFGNTQTEFNAYKAVLDSKYEFAGTEQDEYGDTWYFYDSAEYCIDVTYYYYEGSYVLDLYVYFYTEYTGGGDIDDGGNGGNTTDVDLITNEGKGLPTSANGVYDVDFTKATYVKNVTEQGYYLDGCPTLSTAEYNPSVLVIPVEFSDVTAASKGYTISAIKDAFNGGEGATDYYSVHDYYYISSYGKLDLNITVLDTWFRPANPSSYYANATIDYFGQQIFGGDQMIMNEALAYLSESMDLSVFDADGNTCIDAVVLINTLDVDSNSDFQWAYRYWNVYTDESGYYYEYDGVSANDYLWASYQFMLETYDEEGNAYYEDSVRNTYTYIHEFGHVLGADDYYDTSYGTDYEDMPMGGCDVMDSLLGDHNAYTKFNYGWLTSSRLVVAEESVTLTLEDFSKNGDTIIIANNWDDDLGAYQEYYIVVYYTMNGLNGTVNGTDYGYFSRDGIVVYHVNASLYGEDYDGVTYYDVYNNNTDGSDQYGTADNLIEFVKSPADTYTYIEGDSLSSSITDDQGNQIAYTFTVDALTEDSATLTFRKN